MESIFYVKCDLCCIRNDFHIKDGKSVSESIINSDKKFLRSIIAYRSFNKMIEFYTGVEFNYSYIKVRSYYSRLFKRDVVKKKIEHSTEPIHISLYSEEFSDLNLKNENYRYVNHSEIEKYFFDIINEFGTLDNYKDYLLSLKQNAYDILDDAIKDKDRSKRIKLTKVG